MAPMASLSNAATWSLVQLEASENPAQLSSCSFCRYLFCWLLSITKHLFRWLVSVTYLPLTYLTVVFLFFVVVVSVVHLGWWLLPLFIRTLFIRRHFLLFTPDTSYILLLFSLCLFSLLLSLSLSSSFCLVIITFHSLTNLKSVGLHSLPI